MSPENRQLAVKEEWLHGMRAMRAGEVLQQADCHGDATGRFYYAAFHFARCALLTEGKEVATHNGVRNLLHQDFIGPGKLSRERCRALTTLQQLREYADYDHSATFSCDDSAEARELAEAMRLEILQYLERAGWTPT